MPASANSTSNKAASKSGGITHAYLLLYNTINLLTWSTLLLLTLQSLYNLLTTSYFPLNASAKLQPYVALGTFLKYAETFTLLEVPHVALGLVRTSLGPTITQAYGRTWTVWGVIEAFEGGKSSWAFLGLVMAWSVSEVVRYGFYVSNLLSRGGKPPGGIQWARYNLFVVLYPIGAACEWWLMWSTVEEARQWNMVYTGWMVFSMVVYPILFPNQYMYMIKQRRKMMKAKEVESAKKKL